MYTKAKWSRLLPEIIYKFLTVNKIRFNKNFANCILTGILTDTGNFLYPSTTNETIEIASKMLVYGARFPVITENTYKNKNMITRIYFRKKVDSAIKNIILLTRF